MISVSPPGRHSGRRGIRTHNPVRGAPLATGVLASSPASRTPESGATGNRTRTSATPGRCPPAGPWARLHHAQWTRRESNPDLRHARATSSPWTMGPSIADSAEWTAGESNPDLRRAMPVSSRWTSSPFEERNRPGNRRRSPPIEGPPENRTRSPSLPRRCAAGTPADRLPGSRPGRTRTCAILCVRQASSPLDDGTICSQ